MAAHCCYPWWSWWCDSLWGTLLWLLSLSCHHKIVVLEISLQFCRMIWCVGVSVWLLQSPQLQGQGGMSVSQNKVLLKEIRPSCHHVIEDITWWASQGFSRCASISLCQISVWHARVYSAMENVVLAWHHHQSHASNKRSAHCNFNSVVLEDLSKSDHLVRTVDQDRYEQLQ